MPKVRRILCHISIEIVERQRVCHRDRSGHTIMKGQCCLVVTDNASRTKKNYCPECASAILEQAQTDLNHMKAELEKHGPATDLL